MKTITVTFKGGNATVATDGYRGSECQRATEELEKLLGAKTSDTPTAEALLPPVQNKSGIKAGY